MTTSSPQPQRLLEADDDFELPAMMGDERRRRGGRNEHCFLLDWGFSIFNMPKSKSIADVESR
ncbi:hypothetical protein SESBI_47492, partial [Sesbania bispinosa]